MFGGQSSVFLVLDIVNIAIGVRTLFFVLRIRGNFAGLRNMTLPWSVLTFSMFFFFLHYVTLPFLRLAPDLQAPLDLMVSVTGTFFLAMLFYAFTLFFKAWRMPAP